MKAKAVRCAARFIPLIAAAVATACLPGPSEPDVTVWETELVAEPAYSGFSGHAGAVSDPNGTDATILIEGAADGAVHAWRIQIGTCAAPRQQLGPSTDYPELLVGIVGSATADTRLGPRLDSANAYHVEVLAAPDDTSRVACGDLAMS